MEETYSSAVMPMSQWTKKAFAEEISRATGANEEEVMEAIRGYKTSRLRDLLLMPSIFQPRRFNGATSYAMKDLESLQAAKERLGEKRGRLPQLVAAAAAYRRVGGKFEGKMPLDKEAVKKIWEYSEECGMEDAAERQGASWLCSIYGSPLEIEKHADEIDALNWVPADRRRFMRILTLDIR